VQVQPSGDGGNVGQDTTSRKKGRILALSVGLIALALGSGAAVVAVGGAGPAAIERGLDVLSMLQQRSPGERATAELTKIKRALPSLAAPEARALSPELAPADVDEVIGGLGLDTPEQLLAPPPIETFASAPAGAGLPAALLTPTFIGGGGGGGGFRGGGGGGGGGGSGGGSGGGGGEPTPTVVTPTVVTPPPQSAVPEPGTWATMIVGMALCGFGLRRRRKPGSLGARRTCAVA
jgi:uncharacterized membrane protein YgcG